MDIVLHVHDEIVAEVDEAKAEAARVVMHRIMNTPPAWASGFPLTCTPEVMQRYGA
jgi:DNA polymerase I-like protein with 3'-5' exonuclease and polymerase domains